MIKIVHDKILINGRSLVGKDESANYLINNYGFTKISLATPIYDICYNLFDMKFKDRKLLQTIGTYMRMIDKDVFIKWALRQVEKYDKVVIADVRQSNEYDVLTANGFFPIRITAPFDQRVERAIKRDGFYPDTNLWEQITETDADNRDYYEIVNDSSFEYLYKQIDDMMRG